MELTKHITFDLETLGNSCTAPIVQIGAVKFTPNILYDKGHIVDDVFKRNIKPKSLDKYGFMPDYETIYWWMRQGDAAKKQVFDPTGAMDLRQALLDFYNWIGKPKEYLYWTHATFDPPILDYNCRKVNLDPIMPYSRHRDIRTIDYLTDGKIKVKRKGIWHAAEADALTQAHYISLMLNQLEYYKYTATRENAAQSIENDTRTDQTRADW